MRSGRRAGASGVGDGGLGGRAGERRGGDGANIRWTVRAVFFEGEKKPKLADYGHWELVSGAGKFAGKTGVGTLTIKPASKTDRLFTFEGEIGPKP